MQNHLLKTIKLLAQDGVQFVICGGIACILQGCDRTTYDLDLNLALDQKNLEKFIQIAKKLKLQPRIPEPIENILDADKRKNWIEEKHALVYTLLTEFGDFQIDLFLVYPISFASLQKNADEFDIDGIKIKVSSIQDLITAKEKVYPLRDKDQFDLKQLKELLHARTASKNPPGF